MLLLPTRPGLVQVALFLTLCVVLGACAPISSSSTSAHNQLAATRIRANNIHSARPCTTSPSSNEVIPVKNTAEDNETLTCGIPVNKDIARRQADGMVVLFRRKSIEQKINDAFHHLGQKIKHGFQKLGHAIKSAAHKVEHFFKETGKKIAKVALKVAAVASKTVSKVVGFIPGVGKVLGKAMEVGSKGLNAASNSIKCKIGGKLGITMHRMDKGMKVMSYIP